MELFSALHSVLMSYPCPEALRKTLLSHLHEHLRANLSVDRNPVATKLYVTRFLTPELQGPELVDAIKTANEELSNFLIDGQGASVVQSKQTDLAVGMAEIYAEFIREWCEKSIDENLVSHHVMYSFLPCELKCFIEIIPSCIVAEPLRNMRISFPSYHTPSPAIFHS